MNFTEITSILGIMITGYGAFRVVEFIISSIIKSKYNITKKEKK